MIHSSARDSITVQTEQVLIEKYDRLYRLAGKRLQSDMPVQLLKRSLQTLFLDLQDCSKYHHGSFKKQKKRRSAWRASRTGIGRCLPGNRFKKCPREPGTSKPYHRRPTVLRRYETGRYENLSTVKTRLYRSLKKLRINLEAPDTN